LILRCHCYLGLPHWRILLATLHCSWVHGIFTLFKLKALEAFHVKLTRYPVIFILKLILETVSWFIVSCIINLITWIESNEMSYYFSTFLSKRAKIFIISNINSYWAIIKW
jgi:hypothetical protein